MSLAARDRNTVRGLVLLSASLSHPPLAAADGEFRLSGTRSGAGGRLCRPAGRVPRPHGSRVPFAGGRSPLGTETARISDVGHAREVRGKVVACAPEPLHEAVVVRCVEGMAALPFGFRHERLPVPLQVTDQLLPGKPYIQDAEGRRQRYPDPLVFGLAGKAVVSRSRSSATALQTAIPGASEPPRPFPTFPATPWIRAQRDRRDAHFREASAVAFGSAPVCSCEKSAVRFGSAPVSGRKATCSLAALP